MPRRSMPHRRADDDGAALVEFALVLVPLLLLVIGTLGFLLTLGLQQSVTHAAAAAAREAAVAPDGEVEQVARDAVAAQFQAVPGLAPSGAEIEVPPVGDHVTVVIRKQNPMRGLGISVRFFGRDIDIRPPAELRSSATLLREDV